MQQPGARAGMCCLITHVPIAPFPQLFLFKKSHLGLVGIVFAVIRVVVVSGHVTAMDGGNDGAVSGSDVSGCGARHSGLSGGVGGTHDCGLGSGAGARSTWDSIILNDVAHC